MKLIILGADTVAFVGTADVAGCSSPRADEKMSFFVTSHQAGDGGAIGGLSGADAHCQELAEAVGSRKRSWRAYLSAAAESGRPPVNARDRIGRGPWLNAKGVQVAADIDDLHRSEHASGRQNLPSKPNVANPQAIGTTSSTGSNPDGTLASGDVTCRNWTSTQGHVLVGHQ